MDKFQSGKYKFSSVKPLFLIGNYVIEERGKEINILVDELIKYKVLIKDLISREVSYSQRNELVTISMYIAANFELYDSFINNIEIPFSKLHMFTRVNKKFLEKYRDYIIVYTLIFGNDKYKNIQDYLQMVETSVDDSRNSDVKDIVEYEAGLTVNGIVVWKNKKDAILLTALGEFKKVKLNEDVLIGQEINANEKKTLKDVKIYISILVVFITIVISIPAAKALSLYNFKGKKFFELLVLSPAIIPTISIAMGVHIFFIKLKLANTYLGVVIINILPCIPYAVRIIGDVYKLVGDKLEIQAKMLGASKINVFRYVTLPLLLPGILGASSMCFIIVFSQYFLTMLIGGGTVITYPMIMFPYIQSGDRVIGSMYSIVFLVASIIVLILIEKRIKIYYKNSSSFFEI